MITEKQLKDLNILDRIEYRQKREGLEINSSLFNTALLFFFTGFTFLFALDVLLKGIILLSSFILFSELFGVLLVIAFIYDFMIIPIIQENQIRKLDEEYFDFKTEIKKRGKK